jgi:hypothetical protein
MYERLLAKKTKGGGFFSVSRNGIIEEIFYLYFNVYIRQVRLLEIVYKCNSGP